MTVTYEVPVAETMPGMTVPGNAGHPLDEHPLPFWLSRPCPAWCASLPHLSSHAYGERVHVSGGHTVALTLEPGGELYDSRDPAVTGHSPMCIDVELRQHYRDAEGHLRFTFANDDEPRLTLAEGNALAALLAQLADHAGDLTGKAVKERPFWLAGPCPAWCAESHNDGDHPDDRRHAGAYHSVSLTMGDAYIAFPSEAKAGPGANWQPRYIAVALEQDWREVEPHIVIQYADDKYLSLALAEARELAADITGLLAGAR